MTIATFNELYTAISALNESERTALAGFEQRLGLLYQHEVCVTAIWNLLERLKRPADKDGIRKVRHKVAQKVTKLRRELSAAFYSLQLPEALQQLESKKIALLQQEISKTLHEYRSVPVKSTEAAKKIVEQLTQTLALHEKEKDVVSEFSDRLGRFRSLLSAQRQSLQAELFLLNHISGALKDAKQIPTADIDSWQFNLRKSVEDINNLIREEKELIHEPLDIVCQRTRRIYRLEKRIARKKTIDRDTIERDIKTFHGSDEYLDYVAMLLGYINKLTPQALKLLRRGAHAGALMGQRKRLGLRLLEKIAVTDRLTKLYSRYYLEQQIEALMALSKRGKLQFFSLLMLDIDKFKEINDKYGHLAGDIILVSLATIVKSALRPSDITIRWGGEEFVVLLPFTDKKDAITVASKLRGLIEAGLKPILQRISGGKPHRKAITCSIGVATFPDDGANFAEVLAKADGWLFVAKESGRNRVVTHSGVVNKGEPVSKATL